MQTSLDIPPRALTMTDGVWLVEPGATKSDLHAMAIWQTRGADSMALLKYAIMDASDRLYGAEFSVELAMEHEWYQSEQSVYNVLSDMRRTIGARSEAAASGIVLNTSELRSLASIGSERQKEIVAKVVSGEIPRKAIRAEASNIDVSSQAALDALQVIQRSFEFLYNAGHTEVLRKAVLIADNYRRKVIDNG